MLFKLFVDDTDYETEDGFTLFSYDTYHIASILKIALENGFKDIRISEALPNEKLEYDMRKIKQQEENAE